MWEIPTLLCLCSWEENKLLYPFLNTEDVFRNHNSSGLHKHLIKQRTKPRNVLQDFSFSLLLPKFLIYQTILYWWHFAVSRAFYSNLLFRPSEGLDFSCCLYHFRVRGSTLMFSVWELSLMAVSWCFLYHPEDYIYPSVWIYILISSSLSQWL